MEKIFHLNHEIKEHKRDIVIYGTSSKSLLLFGMLLNYNIYVKCFCELNGKYYDAKIMNKPCIPLEKLKMLDNPIILLDQLNESVIHHLLKEGIREEDIYIDDYGDNFR